MSIFSFVGKAVSGAVKAVGSVVKPAVRVALSGAQALPVVGGAATVANRILFPNTGRSVDQIYNQAATGAVQQSPFEQSLANLISSIGARVDAISKGIAQPVQPATATAGFGGSTIMILAAVGIVGAILVSRGK